MNALSLMVPRTITRSTPTILVFICALSLGVLLADPPLLVIPAVAGVAAILFIVGDIKRAALMFACFLPHLGEMEKTPILYQFWYLPWAIFLLSWLLNLLFRPDRIYLNRWLAPLTVFMGVVMAVSLTGRIDLAHCPQWIVDQSSPWERTREAFATISLAIFSMSAVQNPRDLKRLYWVFVLSGVCYGLPIFFFGLEAEATLLFGRRQGFFTDVHPAAMHMLFCTIIALSLLWHEQRPKQRRVLMWCIGLFLFTQAFTLSRTFIMTTIVCLLLVVGMTIGLRRALMISVLLGTLGLAAWPILPGSITSSIETVLSAIVGTYDAGIIQGSGSQATYGMRLDANLWGLKLVHEAPWFGVGIGRHTWIDNILLHNYYVAILVEIGIVGTLLYGIIVIVALLTIWRLRGRFLAAERNDLATMMLALFIIFIMILFSYIVTPGHSQGERHMWYLFGIIVACERFRLQSDNDSPPAGVEQHAS